MRVEVREIAAASAGVAERASIEWMLHAAVCGAGESVAVGRVVSRVRAGNCDASAGRSVGASYTHRPRGKSHYNKCTAGTEAPDVRCMRLREVGGVAPLKGHVSD